MSTSTASRRVVGKGDPIIVPNEENLTDKEVAQYKEKEKKRRLRAREDGVALEPVTKQEIRKMTTEQMIEMAKDNRNTVAEVLRLKLEQVMTDPDQLAKTNLATLATTFGILVDKALLLDGLATEHIAIQAKIDINMNSDTALQELNKMREKYAEQNN